MTRRSLREYTFLILFQRDFYPIEEFQVQTDLYLSLPDMDLSEAEKREIRTRVAKASENTEEIDKKIEDAAEGWKLGRIGRVELTILRLALFEILYDNDIPQGVAINEAVELAKKFGGDDSSSFVNGVLAKFAQPQGA